MQIRFVDEGELAITRLDGTELYEKPLTPGIGEIFPCQKVVYDDKTCEWADIYLDDNRVIEGIAGQCFEPIGDQVFFKEKKEEKSGHVPDGEPSQPVPVSGDGAEASGGSNDDSTPEATPGGNPAESPEA